LCESTEPNRRRGFPIGPTGDNRLRSNTSLRRQCFGDALSKTTADGIRVELTPERSQRGHWSAQSAGNDVRERSVIGGNIEGNAVQGPTAPRTRPDRANANGSDLRRSIAIKTHPDARVAIEAPDGAHRLVGKQFPDDVGNDPLQEADVRLRGTGIITEVDNWVDHDLAWTMPGHIAATIGGDNRSRCRGEDVVNVS
jgi:hypothetical protein